MISAIRTASDLDWSELVITALIAKAEHVGLARSRHCSNSVAGPSHLAAVRAPQFAIAPTTIPLQST